MCDPLDTVKVSAIFWTMIPCKARSCHFHLYFGLWSPTKQDLDTLWTVIPAKQGLDNLLDHDHQPLKFSNKKMDSTIHTIYFLSCTPRAFGPGRFSCATHHFFNPHSLSRLGPASQIILLNPTHMLLYMSKCTIHFCLIKIKGDSYLIKIKKIIV